MAREKSPAFQFYPKDFLTDERVRLMSHQERGVYITLICMCWQEGSLPASVEDIARLVGVPSRVFRRIWAGPVGRCFYACVEPEYDGRWRHKRLDEEREKQETYRRRQSDKGKASAANRKATEPQPNGNHGSTAVQPETHQPGANSSSPICNLPSPSVPTERERSAPPPKADARSKRPIFTGRRLVVFEWMHDDLERMLGKEHFLAFDVHEWYFALDAELLAKGEVPPERDGGAWLKARALAEAQRRGIPLKRATVPQDAGKLTTRLATMVQNARAAEGR